jgi:hypothetical protein
MKGYSRSNRQVGFTDIFQFMRSFDLHPERFRPLFTNSDNIADYGVVTMKMMPTRDYHLQSNRRILPVFTKLDEATARQRWYPGNIDVTSAYCELQERCQLVRNIGIKQNIYNGHIAG